MKQKNLLSLLSSSLVLLIFAIASAQGQTATQVTRDTSKAGGQGYAFVAPGGRSTDDATLHFGGGGEYIFKGGGSVGAELGYLGPIERLDVGFGVFSANGGYHFKKASRSGKTVPFVTAGFTGIFNTHGGDGGFNFGGGVSHWFKDRVGLRLEFRDNVFGYGFSGNDYVHYVNARVGLTFR